MNEEIYQKLVLLLKLFEGRPHHLSKFLIDSGAFNNNFLETLRNFDVISIESNFRNITEINDYFNNLLVEYDEIEDKKEKDLNEKLSFLLKEERYEDAARVRDYMIKNNIKINLDK